MFCCFNFYHLETSFTFLFLHLIYVPTFIFTKVFKGSTFLHKLKGKISTKQIAYKDLKLIVPIGIYFFFFFFKTKIEDANILSGTNEFCKDESLNFSDQPFKIRRDNSKF